MNRPTFPLFLLMLVASAKLAPAVPISLTSAGYFEDFDGMGLTPPGQLVNVPAGWTVGRVNAASGEAIGGTQAQTSFGNDAAGSASAGQGLFNFGAEDELDRALGSEASSLPAPGGVARAFQVELINDTGASLVGLSIRYDGEQWRNGGSGNLQGLSMHYSSDGTNFSPLPFSHEFNSPHNAPTAAPLNGDDGANRQANIGGVVGLPSTVAQGARFYLRWFDANDLGPDHGLAIDNLRVEPAAAPPPTPPGTLWRLDFDDQSIPLRFAGNESLAAAASSRFDSRGLWSNPAVPHHNGGLGGITGFSRTILDTNGTAPITWTHVAGAPVRANYRDGSDDLYGDFWFIGRSEFVDWQISGLLPGAEYEMFHYGGWPIPEAADAADERISVAIDTDGDGAVDFSQIAGLPESGRHGVYFPSIFADAQGMIRGRWTGVPAAPAYADTSGFQLALVTVPEPSSLVLALLGTLNALWAIRRKHRIA